MMIRTRISRNHSRSNDPSLAPLIRSGRAALVSEYLARGGDSDRLVSKDATALAEAAWRGDLEVVRLLLDAGADPGAHPANGQPPLVLAAANGFDEVVRELLRAGAPISQQTGEGALSALHAAAQNGQCACVRLLLGRGARPHQRDRSGRTPLHHAAASVHPPTVEALLAAGAQLRAEDREGLTPLHLSIKDQLSPGWHRRGFRPSQVLELLMNHAVRTGDFPREYRSELLYLCRQCGRDDYLKAVTTRPATLSSRVELPPAS